MKSNFIVIIMLVSALFLMGAKDYKPVGESLGELEKFLSSWVETMDHLEGKVGSIEEGLAREAEMSEDLKRVLTSIERNLSEMNERLKLVEKLPTFFSEMPTETLGKTLRFYNETIAELKKAIEGQQVVTSVLEKKYQEAQRPLEPLKRELEGVKKEIAGAVDRAEQNAISIEEFQRNLQTAVMDPVTEALQKNEKVLLAFSRRIASLEEHAGIAEAEGEAEEEEEEEEEVAAGEHEAGHGVAEHEAVHGAELGVTEHGAAPGEHEGAKAAAAAEPEKTPEEEGYQDIGAGFYIKNVKFESFGSSTMLKGELKNYSKKDYSVASFTIKVYNTEDLLIGSDEFTIRGFKHGIIKSFDQIITGVRPKKIFSYSITFDKPY